MRKIIKNAAQLLTVSQVDKIQTNPRAALGIIENGAIVIEKERIAWVGKTQDLPEELHPDIVIDASGKVVMPGLIDPHTHVVFAGYREKEFADRLLGRAYRDIAITEGGISSTMLATNAASKEKLYNLAYKRLDRMPRQRPQ